MVKVVLTSTPCTDVETITVKVPKGKKPTVALLKDAVSKDKWKEIHAASDELRKAGNTLAAAFAEVHNGKKYDDELSGELTVALDEMIAPPVPKVKVKVGKKKDGTTGPVAADKKPAATKPKGKSVAAQVREMIKDNPKLGIPELIELVVKEGLLPEGRAKVYVRENVKRVRG
jgi:hypothetical protein